MNIGDALTFTQSLIENHSKKPLNDSQMTVLRGCLEGKLYREIDNLYNFSEDYSKEIGSDLWKILSEIFGVTVTKKNLRNVIEQKILTQKEKISDSEISPKCNDEIRDFVGRDSAITDINNLVNEGRKIIIIQAAGGVGKTTLAKQYLYKNFDLVLPLEMAKDTENITAIESVVEEWLKQHFQEEPGRKFGITLSRLKTQLQTRKVGVLIDNLEPALDEQGRFVEKHKSYVRLLGILADANVQSVTLITSRERLCDDRVNGSIYNYPLSVLDVTAWQEFFTSYQIKIDTFSLEAMHKVYGGNAKAMDILLGVIREDYKGDMSAYWQENCSLVETELKNLVESQFKRLQTLDPEAYKLLCRLGCFRYQDVPKVSIDALLALLWDIPENKRRSVIKSLRNRCLVEFENREYWLHPVVREQGIERLKASGRWEEVNHKAAEFWTESVKTVVTIGDAKKAFEAYYQYININNYQLAAHVILEERAIQWQLEKDEPLGRAFFRLGLLQPMKLAIMKIVPELQDDYNLSQIYNILGDICWSVGDIHQSIKFHEKSKEIAITFNLKKFELISFFNIGLCYIDMGEIEIATTYFERCLFMAEHTSEINTKRHTMTSFYCLAFLNSCLGLKEKSLDFVDKVLKDLDTTRWTTWAIGYRYLFLGKTYTKLMDLEQSCTMYIEAISYANNSNYPLVKAIGLTGLAELYRIQNDFQKALSSHSESIEILDKIGAKECGLNNLQF